MARKKIKQKIVWQDMAGVPITYARINKYRHVLFGTMAKFHKTLSCLEAAMDKDDLQNEGEVQVMKALQAFDPVKALDTVTKVDSRKKKTDEDHLQWKRDNREEALELAEKKWVASRLHWYFWRLSYKNSKTVKGGETKQLDAMLAKANCVLDFDGVEKSLFSVDDHSEQLSATDVFFPTEDIMSMNDHQASEDWEGMKTLLEEGGEAAVQAKIAEMQITDNERYESLVAFINNASESQTVYSDARFAESEFDKEEISAPTETFSDDEE